MLVPIANWAAFGGTKEIIVWMPIAEIATTITHLVALRKQIIEDIYQIMGLSDIMRGATDPNETLGAQQLKTQYGSTRIRDKQQEMARLARDLVEITSEIITERFKGETIIQMSQTQLPTKEMQEQKVMQLYQGMMQMQQDPQAMAQMQQAMQKEAQETTIDQVLKFLKDNRAKSFVLDIETDSTIMQDEQREKQQRNEFVQVLGPLLQQISQMVTADPANAEFGGDILKFALAPYRAGRSIEGSIDKLVEDTKAKGELGKGDDPETAKGKIQLQIEQMKDATQKEKNAADAKLKALELAQKDTFKQMELENERVIKAAELQAKQQDSQGKVQIQAQKAMTDREAHQMHVLEKQQDMQLNRQKAEIVMQSHAAKQADMANRANERQMAAQQKNSGGLV
jgi:hypothetical protein